MKTFLTSLFGFAIAATSIPAFSSSYDELCDRYLPDGADRIVVHGQEHDNWKKAKFGDTKSYLEGRKTHYYINLHNGNPIVHAEKCGVWTDPALEGLPRVKGLLITTPEYFRGEMKSEFKTPGYFVRDLPILTDDPVINQRLGSYEGEYINDDLLNNVIRDVIVFMRDKNQPIVDVYFPEQDVTDGFIVGLVSRAVIDKILVNGNEYYEDDEILKWVRSESGDYIWSDILSQDLRWINSYPYRQVDTIFKPGSRPRTTDVIFETKDIYPFRIFAGYDNYGSTATNQKQTYLGFSYGDLWGLDHELIYSFGTSLDFSNFNSHTLQYKVPFDWRHKLSISGNWSTSDPKTSTGTIGQEGTNTIVNLDYEMPLYDYGFRGFTQALSFGVDYKRLENNIEFGGQNIFSSEPEIVQFYGTYEGTKTSANTLNALSSTVVWAPGDITDNNSEQQFNSARNKAGPDYLYWKGLFESKYTEDDTGISLAGIFRAQYSFNKLLSSEQMAVSGPGSVRGFSNNAIRRDKGFIASLELASPYASVLDDYIKTNIRDRVQGFVFLDQGYGKDVDDTTTGVKSNIDLSSYGAGVRFGIGRHLSGVLEYGREYNDELGDGNDSRVHFRMNAAY